MKRALLTDMRETRALPFLLFAGSCAVSSALLTASCGGSTASGPPAAAGAPAGGGSATAGAAGAGNAGAGTAGAIGIAGASGAGTAGAVGSAGAGGADLCQVDADCTWGEIPNEILKPSDCICLFGCGYLPQTVATAQRRERQEQQLCKPNVDGMGQSCPVDDCAEPGPLTCAAGVCKAKPLPPVP